MIAYKDAITAARAMMGTPYDELDCINLIKKVIRTAPGGVPGYTTAHTNALWDSYEMSARYKDLTWRQNNIEGARAGMLAFKLYGLNNVGHVGIVTDDGTVIHSSSAAGRVVETPINEREGWDLLGVHRYIGVKENREMNEDTVLFRALVVTSRTALNLREEPSVTSMEIEKIPKGATVEVLEKTNAEWWRVRYKGEVGYAAEEYLSRIEDSSTITISRSVAKALYDALGEALGAAGVTGDGESID